MEARTTSLPSLWVKYIETPLDKVGLLRSQPKRFIAFSLGTMGILYLTKPKTLYDSEGKPFPSALMSSEEKAVPMDWITTSIFVGVLSILFI